MKKTPPNQGSNGMVRRGYTSYTFWIWPGDRDLIRSAAEASGVTMAKLIRNAALREARQILADERKETP